MNELGLDDRYRQLIGETDAAVWAKVWLATIEENPSLPSDEGTMIAWFANAIEVGRDAGQRKRS